MEKVKRSAAIKRYFERKDEFAPDGGRKVEIPEMRELLKTSSKEEYSAIAKACANEIGVEIEE